MKDFSQFKNLSPFELKDVLIEAASENTDKRPMLNAGRGNPNFLATEPREAFFYLGLFSLEESKRAFDDKAGALGGFPIKDGIVSRFETFVKKHSDVKGVKMLSSMYECVQKEFSINGADFLLEITTALMACNYPVPPRMLAILEKVVGHYILKEMGATNLKVDDIDLFALEGGTAAMTYIFNTLSKLSLLKSGDKIALGMPIFQPYIEFSHLKEYNFVPVNIMSTFESNWQYTKTELDKLLDPSIKAFYVVNPTNPTSSKLSDEVLNHIAEIVKKRPDLIILTDDVYATFTDNFKSLFAVCPYNTILVYSFSKYFGATGWRLGIVATHKKNLLDDMIQKLPDNINKELDHRYETLVVEPRKIKFIDRIVAESRSVALNHTSGLSLPQQVQMTLFAMFDYIDKGRVYNKQMKQLVKLRQEELYKGLELPCPTDPNGAYYYHMFDFQQLATELHDADFGKWLLQHNDAVALLYRFADEGGLVFLNGQPFGIEKPCFRISLANLSTESYQAIGKMLKKIMGEYYKEYKK